MPPPHKSTPLTLAAPVTPHAGSTVIEGNSPPATPLDGVQNLRDWKAERRGKPPPRSSAEVLQGLPAEMLLNRLDTATIVIGLDGIVIYANAACERLLGYHTARTLEGQSLSTLLVGQSHNPPGDCVELLRDANTVTNWNHSDGYSIAALISDPMLVRSTEPMLMVTLANVEDQLRSQAD